MNYNFKEIEKKWQQKWEEDPYFKAKETGKGKKFYCLDMFPYPSGEGIHVGHWKSYTLSDVYARQKLLQGYNVLHPMGWDAFGLPAENYAIKKKVHPKKSTTDNIANFKRQLKQLGAIYDWGKEVNTTDSKYYKWTQWIFLQMYKAGLAYEAEVPINWCTKCLTGLANEEVVGGMCERCGSKVVQKLIRQWMLRITDYAEKLLTGLDKLAWPEKVKLMQKNWIGKSEGANITFTILLNEVGRETLDLKIFTTRVDTIFGATFVALAPDHPLVGKIVKPEQKEAVDKFQREVSVESRVGSDEWVQGKIGVFTGSYAINPVNNEHLPIYLASYILLSYGSGAVMAVPAHDERDFEFAQKYNLPIKEVIKLYQEDKTLHDKNGKLIRAMVDDGMMINSENFNGLSSMEAVKKIIEFLKKQGFGRAVTCYKLRDWVFSRQRYWGEPIPLIHCSKCGVVPIPEEDLPVTLPDVESYQSTGSGESPLAAIKKWVNVSCPKCGGKGKRETNTMPQWAGSCWYFLRYPNPGLEDKPFDDKDMKYWLPVDLYIGGIEHAILHLLYARFYIKVLNDLGFLHFDEPFSRLFNQGMICSKTKDGKLEKMSKSKGNVVSPDDMIDKAGVDALRLYILFMGPPELDVEWQENGLKGTKNFLGRLWKFLTDKKNIVEEDKLDKESRKRFHLFLKEFQERIEVFKVNTAVSAIMEYLNDLSIQKFKLDSKLLEQFLTVISVMVPYFSSELLKKLLSKQFKNCSWPVYDPCLAVVEETEIAIQINGKLRGRLKTSKGKTQNELQSEAKKTVEKWIKDKKVIKIIFVKDRLMNFVVK